MCQRCAEHSKTYFPNYRKSTQEKKKARAEELCLYTLAFFLSVCYLASQRERKRHCGAERSNLAPQEVKRGFAEQSRAKTRAGRNVKIALLCIRLRERKRTAPATSKSERERRGASRKAGAFIAGGRRGATSKGTEKKQGQRNSARIPLLFFRGFATPPPYTKLT